MTALCIFTLRSDQEKLKTLRSPSVLNEPLQPLGGRIEITFDQPVRSHAIKKKALLTVLGAVIVIFLMFAVFGYSRAWRVWNIPVMSLSFADLRVITHGADSAAQGLDPLVSNPGDPWGRPLNYPRIWQSLYSVGINKSHTIGLGVGFILMFLTGVVMILPNASNMTISLIASALLSPAVLLAVERANIDLFIFFLVSLSVILARKSFFLPSGVIVFATALKLYPVFAISLLLKAGKKNFYGMRF